MQLIFLKLMIKIYITHKLQTERVYKMGLSIVKDGAELTCSLGTENSQLKVPTFHGALLQGGNQATIADYIGNINILHFCQCKRQIPFPACTPAITMKWLKGQKNCLLDGELALLEHCFVPCVFGGIIRFVSTGQK